MILIEFNSIKPAKITEAKRIKNGMFWKIHDIKSPEKIKAKKPSRDLIPILILPNFLPNNAAKVSEKHKMNIEKTAIFFGNIIKIDV